MDQTEAQRLWIRALTTLDSLGDPSPTTKMLRARLFSCVATMLWRVGFSHSLGILHIDALEVAGFCSNEAASLGFISPTVLVVGGIMKGLIESPTEALNHRIQGWKRFELIFAAVEKRNKDLDRRESHHETKVMATPNAYQCAAPGCGIEATKKSGLLRCAGKCPLEFKPSYCSKECQKAVSRVPSYQKCHADDENASYQHWKAHRPVCKSGIATHNVQPDHEQSVADTSSISFDYTKFRGDGKERTLSFPSPAGETVKVTSKTMTPEFMRGIREMFTKESKDYLGIIPPHLQHRLTPARESV